jgi:hypothetical protein
MNYVKIVPIFYSDLLNSRIFVKLCGLLEIDASGPKIKYIAHRYTLLV